LLKNPHFQPDHSNKIMTSIIELQKIATQVRRDIIRMVSGAASGHPGGSLGATETLVALYFEIMKPDPHRFTMDGIGEDLFFLSNGHLSPLWYSVLGRYGYFDVKEMATFRHLNSRLQGHPATSEGLPGIRMASGSLGQGLSVACGAALSKKLNNDPHKVFVLTGDGELQEGQNWEAIMFAAAKKIDNLVAIIDYNGKQIDGPVDKVLPMGNLKMKLVSFGWLVVDGEGNEMDRVIDAFHEAIEKSGKGQPVAILMHTHMGFGVDFMVDNHEWHGVAPNSGQTANALNQLKETLGDY
jgi:transketolase